MDLQEWEILPDNKFLDFQEDGKKVNFQKFIDQLVLTPIQLNPSVEKGPDDEVVDEVTKFPIFETKVDQSSSIQIRTTKVESTEADPESVSKVSFKKLNGNESVDMKLDSPKYNSEAMNCDIKEAKWEEKSDGVNIWKWSLTSIGAICSFGVTAATLCIIIFGSHQKNKQQQQNQKIQFKIYAADEKRINQVVHQTSKLNEAVSTVIGFPSMAEITIGGYLDVL